MNCDYKREDKIRKVVGRVLHIAWTMLCWTVCVGMVGIMIWSDPMTVVSIVMFGLLVAAVIAVGLWLSGELDFCERPPEETPTPKDDTDDE